MSKPWWLCTSKEPTPECAPRPKGFISLADYDNGFRFPTKSSRVPSPVLRDGDCNSCVPNLITIGDPDPLPVTQITINYSNGDGRFLVSPILSGELPAEVITSGKAFIAFSGYIVGDGDKIVLSFESDTWVESTYGNISLLVNNPTAVIWADWEVISGVGYNPVGTPLDVSINWVLL